MLLVFKVRISGDQNLEALALRSGEQRAVGQSGPAELIGCRDGVVAQVPSQRDWHTLIEQDTLSGESHGAASRVVQDGA